MSKTRFRALTIFERLQGLLGLVLLIDTLALLICRRVNTGTILPGVIGLLLLALLWAQPQIQVWKNARWFARAWRAAQLLGLAWLLSFMAFVAALTTHVDQVSGKAPVAILVLGAGVQGRIATPTLINRLDVAVRLALQYPQAIVVVSGGQGLHEDISEAQAMRAYLLQQGLSPARILSEDRSTSTAENFAFSRPVLNAAGIDPSNQAITVVTSDFHVLRAAAIAARAGYADSRVVAAPTPLSIIFNVYLREYFAWGKTWLWGEM